MRSAKDARHCSDPSIVLIGSAVQYSGNDHQHALSGRLPADKALHDAMCAVDGPNAKDGEGHCPSMLFLKGESHMSEVFSFDTADRIVSGPILAWIKRVK